MSFIFNHEEDSEDIVAQINMTPLIDVMLVLLIIFMVTSSVSLESGINVALPTTNQKSTFEKKSEGVIISLNSKGEIYIQGKVTSRENLKKVITSELLKVENKLIIFEGDKGATLGSAISIIDIAKSAGAKDFAIATKQH